MATTTKSPALQVLNSRGETSACWSCGDMRAAHFCEACGKLQPAGPTDYFSFFELPRKLNVDTAALEQDFYRLSRKLHPDLYVSASQQERDWSLEKSSQLNAAYRTLKDPIARTEYLLRLEGLHFDEQSKTATERARQTGEQKRQIVPPSLLEEVFELNMQLEEYRAATKLGEENLRLKRELKETRERLEAKFENLTTELHGYWNEWDGLSTREQMTVEARRTVLDKMLDLLNRRTYIRNLVRDVNETLEN